MKNNTGTCCTVLAHLDAINIKVLALQNQHKRSKCCAFPEEYIDGWRKNEERG